ncbi:MAG: sugar phosphate isomerase/epimerase family protein [Promethearchaeati archaeon SRVP18_Atabeyarchaeia-1]
MQIHLPALAISSWVSKSLDDVMKFAVSLGFEAVELDCDEKPIPATRRSRVKLKEAMNQYELKVFYHSPFLDQAIGSVNPEIRQNTFNTLKMYLDFLEELEAKYLIVHAGVDDEECPRKNVADDLTRLVEISETKSITICIENLRFGLSSDPYDLSELAEVCGSKIAFDLGHANSCNWALSENRSSKDFLKVVASRVVGAHIYLKEEGGKHHPFTRIDEIRDALNYLSNLNTVNWWTIELPSIEDTIREKLMLEPYFRRNQT